MRGSRIHIVLAICAFALVGGAAWAGRGQALGSVVQANNSHIDNDAALAGADVYACDVLDTDSYGELRVQFHASQIVLGTSSQVVLDGSPNAVRVIVVSGSTSFSAPSSAELVIDTPAGNLREASGQAYAGSVTVTGPKELVVAAARGNIALNSGSALHTVPAGKSARITFDRAADASCRRPAGIQSARNPRKVGFEIIAGAAGLGGGYAIWHELQESATKPD